MKIGIDSKTQSQISHNLPKTLKQSWLVYVFLAACLIIYFLLYVHVEFLALNNLNTRLLTNASRLEIRLRTLSFLSNSDVSLTDPTDLQEKSDAININNAKDVDINAFNARASQEESEAADISSAKDPDVNISKTTTPPEESSTASRCIPIFYSNGGKMGSSALAALLKHKYPSYAEYDPDGPFDDAGKELCWYGGTVESFQRLFKTHCKPPHQFALDACPKPSSEERMINIKSTFPEAVIIMFMREQGAAALSYFNDRASSGSSTSGDISEDVLNTALSKFNIYDFVERYKMLCKHFDANKIVVVQTENMRSDDGALEIITAIAKAAGFSVPAQVKGHRNNNADHGGERYNKGWIKAAARDRIKGFWLEKNKVMEELVPRLRLHSSFYPDLNATDAAIAP